MSSTAASSKPEANLSPMEALWAHVLRKDKLSLQPRTLDMPQVPSAPADRNATSTRILLYDTQARLEQFSSRADAMLKGMQGANHQLKTVGMLFEKDRETQTSDMIDLVNRCQTEILKTVGRPAQEPELSAFQEKLELRVEGLNQRLDALQMFNQTHCQALETHSQTLKSMQDQQNALLSAILPLLTLVQSVVPHIENVKTCIQEVNTSITTTLATMKQDMTSSLALLHFSPPNKRKRRLSGLSTTDSPLSQKKARKEPLVSPSSTRPDSKQVPPATMHLPIPIPVKSPSIRRIDFPKPAPGAVFRHRSIFNIPQSNVIPSLRGASPRSNSTKVSPQPWRLQPPQSLASPTQSSIPPTLPKIPSVPSSLRYGSTTPPQSPPKIPLRSKGPASNQKPIQPPATIPAPQTSIRGQRSCISHNSLRLPENVLQPQFPVSELSRPMPKQICPTLPKQTSIKAPTIKTQSSNIQPRPNGPGHSHSTFMAMGSFIPGNKHRERRSPPKDGRRFIPLDDDDDDDDEEDVP